MKKIDLTGKKFGRLTVIKQDDNSYIGPNKIARIKWICKCDCGKIVSVQGSSLRSGSTLSCGCLQKERTAEHNKIDKIKEFNDYIIDENVVKIFSDDKNKFCIIDIEDLPTVAKYRWSESRSGYWVAKPINGEKSIYMHRLVMEDKNIQGYQVDHINGMRNDNRKNNLRKVTKYQNSLNHKVASNSQSGTTGVSFKKETGKWQAYIRYNKKQIYLGYYDKIEDAIIARKQAEQKYFKEYARHNS